MELVYFTNSTDKPFDTKYDGQPRHYEPGEGRWLKQGIAEHHAYKLAEQVLLAPDPKKKFHPTQIRAKAKEFISETESVASEAEAEEKATNLNMKAKTAKTAEKPETAEKRFCNHCDSKGVRHKKECPTLQAKVEETEKEFAELNETA